MDPAKRETKRSGCSAEQLLLEQGGRYFHREVKNACFADFASAPSSGEGVSIVDDSSFPSSFTVASALPIPLSFTPRKLSIFLEMVVL